MLGKHLQSLAIGTLLVLVVFSAMSGAVYSQDVAVGQATANVLTSLSVTAIHNLDFGNIFQGIAKSMGKNIDDSSGQFRIIGAASAGLSVYLSLPDYMALADGSDRLTVWFSTTDANIDTTFTAPTPATFDGTKGWIDQNPRNLPAATIVGPGGETRIYLGGRVVPSVNQKPGAYTGDIICSVAYTGA